MYSESSLKYAIEKAGFDVIDIKFTGFPRKDPLLGHNRENLICIARPAGVSKLLCLPSGTSKDVYFELKDSYRKLNNGIFQKNLKAWLRSTMTLLKYSAYTLIIDRLSFQNRVMMIKLGKKINNLLPSIKGD